MKMEYIHWTKRNSYILRGYIRLFFWSIMPKLKGKKLKVLRKLKAIFPLKLKVSEVFLPIFSKTQGTGGFWGYQRGLKSKNISWITYIKAEKGYFVKCRAVLNKLKGFLRKTQGFCRKNSIFSQKNSTYFENSADFSRKLNKISKKLKVPEVLAPCVPWEIVQKKSLV